MDLSCQRHWDEPFFLLLSLAGRRLCNSQYPSGFGVWRGYLKKQEGGIGFCRMGVWTAEEEKEWDFTGSLAEEKGEERTEQMGGADGSQLGSALLCATEIKGTDGSVLWAGWEVQTKFIRQAFPLNHVVQRGCPLLSKVLLSEEPECSWIQSEPQTLSTV